MTVSPHTQNTNQQWICVGVVATSHGVKGAVKITTFTESKSGIKSFSNLFLGNRFDPVKIIFGSQTPTGYIATLSCAANREEAMQYKGVKIFAKRDDLPKIEDEETFYHIDLEGLTAVDLSGKKMGKVVKVQNYGAGDLIELLLLEKVQSIGKSPLIPFLKVYFPEINLKEGTMQVDMDQWMEDFQKGKAAEEGQG